MAFISAFFISYLHAVCVTMLMIMLYQIVQEYLKQDFELLVNWFYDNDMVPKPHNYEFMNFWKNNGNEVFTYHETWLRQAASKNLLSNTIANFKSFTPFKAVGEHMGCVQGWRFGARASPSEVYPAGKLQWHFTCGFNFRHGLWLPFVAGLAILNGSLIVPVGTMSSFWPGDNPFKTGAYGQCPNRGLNVRACLGFSGLSCWEASLALYLRLWF